MAVKPGLCLTWSELPKTGFLTTRLKGCATEVKWIELLQAASPFGFNDTIYFEANISKMPDFGVVYKNVDLDIMVYGKRK